MEPLIRPDIELYATEHTTPLSVYMEAIAERTLALPDGPRMMLGPLAGSVLKMITGLQQPMHVVEIGTFTGYSALCMAEALPEGGKIVTLEANPEHARIAREHIGGSPYADRIEVREGHAMELLAHIRAPLDLVFIDADKVNYLRYYEAVLPLLRSGGAIVADNVLWYGQVLDPDDESEDTEAIREFNRFVSRDDRVESVMLTVRDGLMVIRKV
jgi:caffeoyl-CoA O-methyltransferase